MACRISVISRHISSPPLEHLDDLGVRVAPEVRSALSSGVGVVALESTIVSHGMPYPQNFHTAQEVESIVRANGAVPATIAILDGVPCIGLSLAELERLAKLGTMVSKTARRDIPYVIARRGNGATTVSATMFFASKAGIKVFVTGGIGGVHRQGESTMDVSSDLTELGKTPVAVVCAGVKSILDIPRTLEYLETQGVTVVSYSTDEFPAFFTPNSGCKAPCRADSVEECADIIEANTKLGLGSGILIGVPIPAEHAAAAKNVESAIQSALHEAEYVSVTSLAIPTCFFFYRSRGIAGNSVTPFLLKRVNELTGGDSLAANIQLVKNNALVGAKIATALTTRLSRFTKSS
ncbi:uncharacterized protein LOC9644059 isoform X1 [Selaginella moellendorffii]|uniref:uncharacterized protein LOC9644059 isoform X1 n=1 Tax=Selaginella moellendorffii TaxID=88036 RepID=UPI000D1C8D1B|nr:uncharacterized protein LOC9644059 isoform X1 [Selaginella moellendorffii]XP_024545175.1 uncharacterized protein LOC9644059 isoform X1 [Selaginella moellendorffii]|eukprot:XP_024545174.1 uncharacterized protein LOC9644059 isoform X1 [Selaginella moellendorffii]